MNTPATKKRPRRAPEQIRPWSATELKKLIVAYKAGRGRGEIVAALGRTTGSVANKIRLLVKAEQLSARR